MSQIQKLSYRQFISAKIQNKAIVLPIKNYKGYGKPCHLLTLEEKFPLPFLLSGKTDGTDSEIKLSTNYLDNQAM